MAEIFKIPITNGVSWVEIPGANLRILCSAPEDVIKHMMRRGLITSRESRGVSYETGPNAILLSDVTLQNGYLSNLGEFPVLQMLYRQGMIIPNHPNNTGAKPLLIGTRSQVQSQIEYIHRGNYGLISTDEMKEAGASQKTAEELMRMKLRFAFGTIKRPETLLNQIIVGDGSTEIAPGVTIVRERLNVYTIRYHGESVLVDMNLAPEERYESPYSLGFYNLRREYFSVVHSGQGDGWDINRPSMGSIIMFQGRIYLIDAGPNILNALKSLGIGISEVEGIFHTHAHDDHFAGLASLLHADHRIKYYATPLVRSCVAKKLSALLGFSPDRFVDYFDICDLKNDHWNNIEGLEVKPVLSPHPVENTIIFFRTLWENGYRTYGHLADTTSLSILKDMVTEDPVAPGISQAYFDKTKEHYLTRCTLKKIDVGGGMIHGDAADYHDDHTEKIILAHTSKALTNHQKEIGSSAPFGVNDTIIPDYQDFQLRNAYYYLRTYFPDSLPYQLRILQNNRVITFNPETILLKEGSSNQHVYLILSGIVDMLQTSSGTHSQISAGAIIGDLPAIKKIPSTYTFRTTCFVNALAIPKGLFVEFVMRNNLYANIEQLQERRTVLQQNRLFSESVSHPVQNRIAKLMVSFRYDEGDYMSGQDLDNLYLIKEGTVLLKRSDKTFMILKAGSFFGGELIQEAGFRYEAHFASSCSVCSIPSEAVDDVPVLRWKLFEAHVRNIKASESLNL